MLHKAVNKIDDVKIKNSYKSALSKMVKQMTKFGLICQIANIDTATAQIDKSDERFAKRLQMAEIELLCKIPSI